MAVEIMLWFLLSVWMLTMCKRKKVEASRYVTQPCQPVENSKSYEPPSGMRKDIRTVSVGPAPKKERKRIENSERISVRAPQEPDESEMPPTNNMNDDSACNRLQEVRNEKNADEKTWKLQETQTATERTQEVNSVMGVDKTQKSVFK